MPDHPVPPTEPFASLERIAATEPQQRRPWALLLLLVPLAAVAWPPLYDRRTPTLGGLPFFVWYQVAVVIAAGAVTGLVYLLRGRETSLRPGDDA